MSITFKDGAILKDDVFYNKTLYDVSNNLITAQFDGRGNISRYAVINKWDIIEGFYSTLSINDVNLNIYEPKQVSMIGKIQKVKFKHNGSNITLTQFIDDNTNAIFTEYQFESDIDADINLTFNLGLDFTSYLKQLFSTRLSLKTFAKLLGGYLSNRKAKNKEILDNDDCYIVKNNILGDFYLDLAMSGEGKALEREKIYYNQYNINLSLKAGEIKNLRFVLSAGTRGDYSYCDVHRAFKNYDKHYNEALDYVEKLPNIDTDNQMIKSYYKSLVNCSLSMYKELGDFKGFIAGINYQSPARTYYRDSYWTVLSVISSRPELVRNQIITLSGGIDKDGKCPSAVKYNFKNWWGDHYDSPSFFAILLYDYVKHTGDISILDEKWRKGTILAAAQVVIDRLSLHCDHTGLLVKSGEFNRRDWADNVFRTGYVTYDEALYARALFALSELYLVKAKKQLSAKYSEMYIQVKDSINHLLWDEDKGYFINYKDGDFVEDNLSIDTVTIALFSLADELRIKKMLEAMETKLETRNNSEQKAGDYGVMCVYPFYKNNKDLVSKSSYPYYYHNGADWPYLSGIYAYAKIMYGMDYKYPLFRWFDYNISKGNYTPVEFFAPPHADGSMLQGWSSTGAFVLGHIDGNYFR